MAKNKKKKNNPTSNPPVKKEEKALDSLSEQQLPNAEGDDLDKELLALFNSSEGTLEENNNAASEAEELLKDLKTTALNDSFEDSLDLFEEALNTLTETEVFPSNPSEMTEIAEEMDFIESEPFEEVSLPVEGNKEPDSGDAREAEGQEQSDNKKKRIEKIKNKKKDRMNRAAVPENAPTAENTQEADASHEKAAESVETAEASDIKKTAKEKSSVKEGSPLHMVRLVVVLTAICVAVAGLLAVVNHVTKDTIAENDRKAREAAVLTVFPEGDSCKEYTTADGTTLYFAAQGENLIGYCVNVSPAGYSGDIDMMVGIGADGTVSGIKIVSLSETPGVGTKVTGDSFLSQFLGIGGEEHLEVGVNVDGIGGATFSSKGVTAGVNEALSVEFDLYAAAAEVGLKVSDSVVDPGNNGDSNDDNGDETLSPETVGEAEETEPAETDSAETEAPETEPVDTEAPVETAPEETETPETDPWVPETNAPETEPWIPEPVETEPWIPAPVETESPETEAPETDPPETEAPETEPTETAAPETVPPETAEPETVPPETKAPETEPAETEVPDPVSLELNMTLKAVDAEGNEIEGDLDAKLNGSHWIANTYSSDYTVNIGTNTIDGWDVIPKGYLAPEGIVFMVWEDGSIAAYTPNVVVDTDGSVVVFVVTLEEDPYAEYEDGNEVG